MEIVNLLKIVIMIYKKVFQFWNKVAVVVAVAVVIKCYSKKKQRSKQKILINKKVINNQFFKKTKYQ